MFRYGKKSGYMTCALIALGVIPLVVTLCVLPILPQDIPMRFNAAGEVTRWGGWLDVLIIPVFGLLITVFSVITAFRRADAVRDSDATATLTFRRLIRSGIVAAVVLGAATFYFLYVAFTGQGLPL